MKNTHNIKSLENEKIKKIKKANRDFKKKA